MNVAFFNDATVLGGGELWVLKMARALTARGHRISIICPYRSQLFQASLEAGATVFGFVNRNGQPLREPLYHFLRSRETDFVCGTVMGDFCEAEVLSRALARLNKSRRGGEAMAILKTGLPPMTRLGGEYYGFGAGPEIRRLHVVSEDNKKRFIDWQGGGAEVDGFVVVMHEGVELDRFHRNGIDRERARAEWRVAPDEFLIATTSRLHPAKGHEQLLYAAREILRRRPNTRFVFAGAGQYQPVLEDLRDSQRLGESVRFAGQVGDVRPLLVASDVFCHPSYEDGLPNSVAEAMAIGLPVVASCVGGIPEIVEHESNGLLFEAGDVAALTQAILRLVEDSQLRARLGARAAADIRLRLDFDHQVQRWERAVAGELAEFRERDSITAPKVHRPRIAYPVLFLMTHMRTGGEESEVAVLARRLDRDRFPLLVATGWPVDEPSPAEETLRELDVQLDTKCHCLASLDEKADYLAGRIRREGIRLLVACQSTRLAYEVMKRLQPNECRMIEHAGIVEEVEQIPKDLTAMHIGVSPEIVERAAKLYDKPTHTRFLPSMVETGEFDRGARRRLRQAFQFEGKTVVLFVGRLDRKKGVHYLIDAAHTLLPEFPDLQFVVTGPHDAYQREYAQHLIDRARSELPDGRFMLTGARRDVPRLMCAADIFILPSVGEGMSHVINEAGAAGLPVIAFEDGAAREQLADGKAGVLVARGDVAGLVEALRSLLVDGELRQQLGEVLRRRVAEFYSAEAVVPQWMALFEEVSAELEAVAYAPAIRVQREDAFLPFPAEIQIETNSVCNATCIMCPYSVVSKELPGGRMEANVYQKILDECSSERIVHRLEPFLNNEPFTDPRIVDWIVLAKKKVPHAAVTITTNGSLMKPKITDRLIHSGLDAIWFSFNGATRETYEKIMGLSFDQVKANIDYLLSVKPESLRVFTNMIDTVPMKGEIADNIRYWQSRGVNSGSSPLVNRAGNVDNFDELNYRILSERPARICDLLFHKMYIGWNGDVLLCCMDWRRQVVLGNVAEQSLREIWNGEPYQRYRRLQNEWRSSELRLCSSCTYVHS